jgi:hypothetical protein
MLQPARVAKQRPCVLRKEACASKKKGRRQSAAGLSQRLCEAARGRSGFAFVQRGGEARGDEPGTSGLTLVRRGSSYPGLEANSVDAPSDTRGRGRVLTRDCPISSRLAPNASAPQRSRQAGARSLSRKSREISATRAKTASPLPAKQRNAPSAGIDQLRPMQWRISMTIQRTLSAAALLAVMLTAAPAAMAQSRETNLPWCSIVDGSWECVYATLQDCEKWMQPERQACVPNPRGQKQD